MERGPSSVPTSLVLVLLLVLLMISGKSDSAYPGLLMFEVTHLTMVAFNTTPDENRFSMDMSMSGKILAVGKH